MANPKIGPQAAFEIAEENWRWLGDLDAKLTHASAAERLTSGPSGPMVMTHTVDTPIGSGDSKRWHASNRSGRTVSSI